MKHNKNNVQISIFCITYNHAPYIRDAIEGFLMQKTEYPYHIFIFDDASDDGTSEIIKEYQEKYPEKISIYIAEQNTYGKKIREELLNRLTKEHLTGKYIALCEGDDYWIDSYKLQMQVEFMEKHPECSMTVHAARLIDYRTGKEWKHSSFNTTGYLSSKDIILKGVGGIPTASFVMRRGVYFWPGDFPRCDVGDWPRQLFAITKGKIYYFDEIMSVYRYMHDGSWMARHSDDSLRYMNHRLGMIKFLEEYDTYTKKQFHENIRTKRAEYFYGNLYESDTFLEDNDYDVMCDRLSDMTKGEFDVLINKMRKIKRLLGGEFYVDEELKKYIEKKEYIVIWGTGNYSKLMTRHLQQQNINITGYIISDNQEKSKENNVIIWKVKEYPFRWEKTGVIVSVHPRFQTEIEKSLQKAGISDYYPPFWVSH